MARVLGASAERFLGSETDPARIYTSSRVRMWWFTKVRGFTVRLVRRRPQMGRLGRVRYTTTWTLAPKTSTERR